MIQKGFETSRSNKTITLNSDLTVVGGGLAGVCCAITAARSGIKVTLVQDRPVLGGNSSSEVRLWVLGATSHMGNNNRWAREGGVVDEILLENLFRNKEGNPLIVDSILLEMVNKETNITLLLNTSVYEVNKKNDKTIESLRAFCSQNSTTYELFSPLFTDASGDGIVAFQAGASFRMGAESPEEFGEGCAPDIEDYGELLGHSMYFYTKDVGRPVKFVAPTFALKDPTLLPKMKSYDLKDHGCKLWWVEYGGRMDTIHDTETIKWELWKVIYGIWDYVKNSGNYTDSENLTLEWVGTIPGKRESRRFEGDYMLKQQDIVTQKQHYDAVAHGGWAIDLHPADGLYSTKHDSCTQWHGKGTYQIPYRCYYSKDLDNLFLAGRIISATHVAFGSTRVMATNASGSQAVALAAVLATKNKLLPRDISKSPFIEELQSELNIKGQGIPQVPLVSEKNLVDTAKIKTSSELKLSELVADGPWLSLDYPTGQMAPLKKEVAYIFGVLVKSKSGTKLKVDLKTTSTGHHFTPDVLVESLVIDIEPGEQWIELEFTKTIGDDRYGFLCFQKNDAIAIKGSEQRLSGILSVFNKPNKAVSNEGIQIPPEGFGIDSFEFWCPERRPKGHNIGLKVQPPVECYNASNVNNGFIRPTAEGCTNIWSSSLSDENPTLELIWEEAQTVKEIHLFFDTDFDHPLESVLMGHPEDVVPFCVQNYMIYDANNKVVAQKTGNHQSINALVLEQGVKTDKLKIEFEKPSPQMPVSVYQVLCF